jgi:hypothetical protein
MFGRAFEMGFNFEILNCQAVQKCMPLALTATHRTPELTTLSLFAIFSELVLRLQQLKLLPQRNATRNLKPKLQTKN